VPTQVGTETGTLIVTDMLRSQTVTLAGTGVPPPSISPSTASVVFGTYTVGHTSPVQVVTLTNSGGIPLSNLAYTITGDFTIPSGGSTCGTALAVGASCQVGIIFTPSQPGQRAGALTTTATELTQPLVVALSGTGLSAPAIASSAGSISFGNSLVTEASTVQAVTLTNTGGVPLTNLTATVTGDFAVQTGSSVCGASLPVGSSCPLSLTFTPSQPGTRTGLLTVTAKELTSPLTVALTGNGQDFTLTVSGNASQTITSGQTATYTVEITPLGLTGLSELQVAMSCTSTPQLQNGSCAVNSPAQWTLTGQNQVTATVTVTTGQAPSSTAKRESRWPNLKTMGLALAIGVPIGFLARRRRRWRGMLLLGVLVLVLPGCNLKVTPGSSSSPTTGGSTPPANQTPSGVYTITVTGTVMGPTGTPPLSNAVTPPLTLTVE
jgi:hypothetical protein